MKKTILLLLTTIALISCTENYSNGERIGVITQFSRTGTFWKSWEGHLNVTQTGMNSSVPFDFSIDNNNENQQVINKLDSAANLGWKVKLVYHETKGKNWFNNRGETNHFVTDVIVLDKNMPSLFSHQPAMDSVDADKRQGRIIDTIYLVIYKDKP